jgi:hypothetical protein
MTSRIRLLDVTKANFVATKPEIPTPDQIPEPDRATVFYVPTSDMQREGGASLYDYVTSAFTGIGDDNVPAYIDGMEMLGKLAMLAPVDSGTMLAHFILPPGHPDAPEDETAPILGLPVTAGVTDAFVNSGTLTGMDNIVYGRADEGVLFEIAVYIEING